MRKTIDVVIPAYNEAPCIVALIERLFAAVARLPYRFEAIVVDDGSTDGTADAVRSLIAKLPITLVVLTRNFGKETALLAGLDHARGDATILMDADLQHPVELVDRFIDEWNKGYECVYAVKAHRRDEPWPKRVLTSLFYLGVNGGARVRIVPDALDFRLLDRGAVCALRSMRERVRFTKGLYAWLGLRSVGVPLAPPPRMAGASRFDSRALLRLGWDGLTSFSDLPLRICAATGVVLAFAAVLYGLYEAARRIAFGIDAPVWATLTVAITFLSGVQIFFLGVLGQYVRNAFIETKQRPSYLVRDLEGLAAQRGARHDRAAAMPGDTAPPPDRRQGGRAAAA